MRYPTLPVAAARELAESFLLSDRYEAAGQAAVEDAIVRHGNGEDIDLEKLSDLAVELDAAFKAHEGGDLDQIEGRFALPLFSAMRSLSPAILDDPDFWCYLSMRYFWNFIRWREFKTFQVGESANYLKYVDGRRVTESLLNRMYIRAQIAETAGQPELSYAVKSATDLWRSHVIRVSTSYAPHVAAAVIRTQVDDRLNTDDLRAFAKRLNRLNSNVVTSLLTEDEAAAHVSGVRNLDSGT